MAPVHLAAQAGHVSVIEYLCSKGADPHTLVMTGKFKGMTPTHIAVGHGHIGILEYLRHAKQVSLTAPTSDGFAPIHLAALVGDTRVGTYLHSHGVDLESLVITGPALGTRPLDIAARANNTPFVKFLVGRGVKLPGPDFTDGLDTLL